MRAMLSLGIMASLFVALVPSNAEDGVVIRLPARVAFAPTHNLLTQNADATSAMPFGQSAKLARMGLDVTVDIGTPAKPFHLYACMLDGDSWLVGDPDISGVEQIYNASESSSATNLGRSFNVAGMANGSLFADILQIDRSAGDLIAVNQSFGVAEALSDFAANLLSISQVDGFLGLAPLATTPNGVPSLLQTLASTHNITTTTVWIESWSNNSINPLDLKSVLNASITFGGLDSEHCNSTGWVSSKWAIPQQWTINVESIALSTGEKQAVNTETYFMGGLFISMLPKHHADFIANSVNASQYGEVTYSVPCNQLTQGPTIELSFNSQPGDSPAKLQLAPKDYILQMREGFCLLAFGYYPEKYPGPKPWVLGGPVFNRYCVAINTHEGVLQFSESLK